MTTGKHQQEPPRGQAASGRRRRAPRLGWRALASLLAGGGLTAAGLGGSLPAALAAEAQTSTTATDPTPPPATTTTPSAEEGRTETSATTTATPTPAPSPEATGTQPTVPASTSTQPAPVSTSAPTSSTPQPSTAPTVRLRRKQQSSESPESASSNTSTSTSSSSKKSAAAKSATGAAAAQGANNVALPPQLVAAQAKALAAMLASSAASDQALDFYRIPLFLLPIYRAAAAEYGVPWQVLAAINEVETDYGSDQSVSSAGAVGWMQFMPSTWLEYGVDALNAGYADPYNPVDAIFAAGRYLNAAGAATSLSDAILAYNHSEAYVSSVLLRAKLVAAYPSQVIDTLTELVDDRPPVTGGQLSWSAPPSGASAQPPSSSSATAGATASNGTEAPSTPGSQAAPSPASAADGAGGRQQSAKLVELTSQARAKVVAVQDGRVVKIGSSHKLGSYVELEDVYGDLFTYSGLGSIAHSFQPSKAQLAAEALASRSDAPSSRSGSGAQASADSQSSAGVVSGKVRMFAHPGNPDALLARSRSNPPRGSRRALRSGTLVPQGTVLGTVDTPAGDKDGHLRFAIKPAGDASTIDPSAILSSWNELDTALHPQGASASTSLMGATASDVLVLSKSQLEREVLFDPGITMSGCSRQQVASGQIDKRALAVLAFLSRSGLKPTVGTLSCGAGAYATSGYVAAGHDGDAIAIVAINGVPIAGHQGAGSITDTTIRTLLTLQGEFFPAAIVSLMRYPGAPTTHARADHGDYLEIVYARSSGRPRSARAGAAAHAASAAKSSSSAPASAMGGLNATQWEQLIARVAALPVPNVRTKPSPAAIADPKKISPASKSSQG